MISVLFRDYMSPHNQCIQRSLYGINLDEIDMASLCVHVCVVCVPPGGGSGDFTNLNLCGNPSAIDLILRQSEKMCEGLCSPDVGNHLP